MSFIKFTIAFIVVVVTSIAIVSFIEVSLVTSVVTIIVVAIIASIIISGDFKTIKYINKSLRDITEGIYLLSQ